MVLRSNKKDASKIIVMCANLWVQLHYTVVNASNVIGQKVNVSAPSLILLCFTFSGKAKQTVPN